MDILKFIALRPFLYHLTDEENVKNILKEGSLNSAAILAKRGLVPDVSNFLRTRRVGHYEINNGSFVARLRDQDPLFEKIVMKNLQGGWSFGDFVNSLNSRVFFWPTEKDLRIHYLRYENQGEFPQILKFSTADIFTINKIEPEFCRLNSGAPRCSSYYVEGAPPRGPQTFQKAPKYLGSPSSIREVTFLNTCILPKEFWLSSHPNSPFRKVTTLKQ